MTGLWKVKYLDWSGVNGGGVKEFWNCMCDTDAISDGAAEFDMRMLLLTRLDVESNGFNVGLLN